MESPPPHPLASASTDRASVFIKAQPVCMTATETLVSSRLMKTNDTHAPRGTEKEQKAGERKTEIENTTKTGTQLRYLSDCSFPIVFFVFFFHCQICLGSLHTSPSIPCTHTPTPLSNLSLSLTAAAAPW